MAKQNGISGKGTRCVAAAFAGLAAWVFGAGLRDHLMDAIQGKRADLFWLAYSGLAILALISISYRIYRFSEPLK